MLYAPEIVQKAVYLAAAYGDGARTYASQREKAAGSRAAAGRWRQIAEAIEVMNGFDPTSRRRS